MIRLIFKISNQGGEGQSMGDSFKTIDIDLPKAEEILKGGHSYCNVSLVGCEILEEAESKGGKV